MEQIHILSLGAGVQSSTLALLAADGVITPMPTAAIFADTMCEPAIVYDWLNYLETLLPFPVIRISKGNLGEAIKIRTSKTGAPYLYPTLPAYKVRTDGETSIMQRSCTTHYKLHPIWAGVGKLMRENKVRHSVLWIGISTDEAHRMKDSARKRITNRYPLIEHNWNRIRCRQYLQQRVDKDVPKSSCVFCPFRDFRLNTPQEMAHAIRIEQQLQQECAKVPAIGGIPFLHRSCRPLSEIDFTDYQLDLFGNECEGMCGV